MEPSFVVLDVPSQETLIGQLTLRDAGCVVDLLGRPLVRDDGHVYDLHYVITGHSVAGRQAMEAHLEEVYSKFETLNEDPWVVRCEVPVENIRSPGLRFVAGLFGLAPMPWLEFRGGVAHARLLAAGDPESVQEVLAARLDGIGVDARPHIERGHMEAFRRRVEAAGWPMPSFWSQGE